ESGGDGFDGGIAVGKNFALAGGAGRMDVAFPAAHGRGDADSARSGGSAQRGGTVPRQTRRAGIRRGPAGDFVPGAVADDERDGRRRVDLSGGARDEKFGAGGVVVRRHLAERGFYFAAGGWIDRGKFAGPVAADDVGGGTGRLAGVAAVVAS